jgi:hypothetical protein
VIWIDLESGLNADLIRRTADDRELLQQVGAALADARSQYMTTSNRFPAGSGRHLVKLVVGVDDGCR